VAANIAEGSAKKGPRQFRRFLDIALGSFAELRYALRVAHGLDILPEADLEELREPLDRSGKLLWKLYQSMNH
jgi:four helix bundle protein